MFASEPFSVLVRGMILEFSQDAASGTAVVRFVAKEDAEAATGLGGREFSGDIASTVIVREDGRRVCWVGTGTAATLTPAIMRRAAGAAVRKLVNAGETAVYLDLPAGGLGREAVESASIGAYTFDRYKTGGRRETQLERLVLPAACDEAAAAKGLAVAEAVNRVRDIGNTPPNILTPTQLAEEAKYLEGKAGATVWIWNTERLSKEGFGGILAVGGGSRNSPRFILVERMRGANLPTVAIVGKAITFDSGGLSIKPRQSMDEMKYDKMGGVAALGIVEAVAALDLPINIVAAICSAENLPGEGAFRPSDVINVYGGKSVEIIDTDAEGRVVLADGLAYIRKHYETDLILDLATLTGACCIALGLGRSGVFTADDALAATLHAAGEDTLDRCWRLPLGEDYSDAMKSRIADILNLPGSRWGGASTAAAFLQFFAGDARWAHLDIAGPALLLEDRPEMEKGASGAGVRLVVETLERLYGQPK